MKKLILLTGLLAMSAQAQWTPWGLGFIQKPNALSARFYLGVPVYTNGSGITFTLLPSGIIQIVNSGAGSGTVTTFSAGNLSPLFTSSVATAGTTPALSFALVSQAANLVYSGPASGGAASPTFRSLVSADLPAISLTNITDVGTAAYSNANAFVLSPTNSGTDGQVVSKTGTKTKWVTVSGGSGSGIDISLTSLDPYSQGTNFLIDMSLPAQAINATGTIAFNYSTNWGLTSTSRVVNIYIPATNYARKVLWLAQSTNWNIDRLIYTVPFAHGARIQCQSFAYGETNMAVSCFLDSLAQTNIIASFDPTSVSGLKLWVRAGKEMYQNYDLTVPVQNGSEIRSWRDLSGTGNTLTNNVSGAMNSYFYNANSAPFNIPSFYAASGLAAGQNKLTSATFAALTQPNWVFIVYYSTRGGDPAFDGAVSGSRTACFPSFTGSTLQLFAGTSLTTTSPTQPQWMLFSFKANGASSIIRTNGQQAVTGNAGAQSITAMCVGTDQAGAAITKPYYMSEELIYNANLSNGDRDNIEEYLRAIYALW